MSIDGLHGKPNSTRLILYRNHYNENGKLIWTEALEEKKNGKWIKMSDADGIYWACSECGEDIPRTESIEKTKYCPNCGANMRGETDE